MIKGNFKVDTSKFKEELKSKPVKIMNEVYKDHDAFRETVYNKTYEKVPLDTGVLRHSLYTHVLTRSDSLYIQDFEYSAKDPEDGYDYAEYQHNTLGLFHPKGGNALYLKYGILEAESLILKDVEKAIVRALK